MKQTSAVFSNMDSDSGKNPGFMESVQQEKHDRLARNALHSLFNFCDELEGEMERLQAIAPQSAAEQQLYEYMLKAHTCYQQAMQGFRTTATEAQHHALVCLSDALLDLMKLLNRQKLQ